MHEFLVDLVVQGCINLNNDWIARLDSLLFDLVLMLRMRSF